MVRGLFFIGGFDHDGSRKADLLLLPGGGWLHHLADGVKDDLEMLVVFLFHGVEFPGQIGVSGQQLPKLSTSCLKKWQPQSCWLHPFIFPSIHF